MSAEAPVEEVEAGTLPESPDAPGVEDITKADLLKEIIRLRQMVEGRQDLVEQVQKPLKALAADITGGTATPKTHHNVREISEELTPELYGKCVELEIPKAQFPEEAVYAVRLKTQGKGYTRAFPRAPRVVRFADPVMPNLIPKLRQGEFIPEGDLKNPQRNFIGHGKVIPWFVPSLGYEVFCDPRASAHAGTPQVDKVSLWCLLFEMEPGSTHAHCEHGAFCGTGQEPDRIQHDIDDPEDAGRCMLCKGHDKKRTAVREQVARVTGREE